MRKPLDLTGKKVGKLTAIKKTTKRDNSNKILWECLCECGNTTFIRASDLKQEIRKSCGCSKIEFMKEGLSKHGCCKDRLYKIWVHMKSRCYNKNFTSYKNYGERGIKVCDEWKYDFISFRQWALENGYKENLSIDRIDVDGNYEPKNCKWSTFKEQSRNKRTSVKITINGKMKNLNDWCKEFNISFNTVRHRMKRKYPKELWFLPSKEFRKKIKRGEQYD